MKQYGIDLHPVEIVSEWIEAVRTKVICETHIFIPNEKYLKQTDTRAKAGIFSA